MGSDAASDALGGLVCCGMQMQVEPMDLVLMCGAVRSLEAVTKDNDEFEVSPFLGPALASLGAYKEALAFLSNSEPRVDAYDINKHFIYVQVP